MTQLFETVQTELFVTFKRPRAIISVWNRKPGGRVIERRVYRTLSDLESLTNFDAPQINQGPTNLEVTEVEKNSSSSTLRMYKHTFWGNPYSSSGIPPLNYSKWNEGREFKVETQASGGAVVRSVEHTWNQRDPSTNQSVLPAEPLSNFSPLYKPNDPRIVKTTTIQGAMSSFVDFQYSIDTHNNVKKKCEYDYGASTPTRCTEYDYETASTYVDPPVHLRGLVKSERVSLNTTLELQTDTTYDEYGGSNVKLVDRNGISEHDPGRRQTYATRGNPTTISRWLSPSAQGQSWAKTHNEYDIAGNIVKIQHPMVLTETGLVIPETTASYNDNYDNNPGEQTFAFPTQVTQAGNLTINAKYYYKLGQIQEYTDPNGRKTSYFYGEGDPLDRLTRVIHAIGSTTQFSYTPTEITTSKSLSAGVPDVVSKTVVDGLGRTSQTIRLNACGAGQNAVTETRYDPLGRASEVSNPICGSPSQWTRSTFDELDRLLDVTYPDSSVARTRYTSNEAVTRDPEDKWRKVVTDALGRVKEVVEDPSATIDGTFANSGPQNLSTTYTYDARNNLKTVTQSGRNRDFTYDSVGLLKTASSPEMGISQDGGGGSDQNGIVTYAYDPAGNMTSRTAPRSTSAPTDAVTSFVYDIRGRLKTKSYSGAVATTSAVNYCYDGSTAGTGCSAAPTDSDTVNNPKNLKGRLTMVNNGDATSTFDSYDGLGRVTTNQRTVKGQTTPSAPDYTFSFSYGYNHLGLESVTYPSGRKVQYGYDGAAQIQTVTGNPGTTSTKNYVTSVNYAAHGAIAQMALANQRYEVTCYNSRLQVSAMLLRTQAPTMGNCGETTNNLAKLSFAYEASSNGNLKSQTISDGASFSTQQSYTYDKLNRLKTGSEPGGSGWLMTYDYDRWGNQWLDTVTNLPTPNAVTPRTVSWFTAKNRLTLGSGGYDLSGNQLKHNPYTLTYDGENLVREMTSTSNGSASYRYDGEGRRVKKVVGAVTTYFAYDASGQLAAEYEQGNTGSTAPCETCFLFADHLGSTRVIHDGTGVRARYDYLPFGEYVPGTNSGRSTASCAAGVTSCYPGTGINTNTKVTQMFTSKERDAETGLDYFGARYLSAPQGRFTSPDEFTGGAVDPFTGQQVNQPGPLPYADITNPQSLNKYAYVLNNPLRYTDPDGHCVLAGIDTLTCAAVITAAAGATSAYLASPQGQKSIAATTELFGAVLDQAADFVGGLIFNQSSSDSGSAPPPSPETTTQQQSDTATPPPPPGSGNQNDQNKGDKKADTRQTKPEKNTLEGAQNQREGISKAQSKLRTQGQGERIRSIEKSMQREKHQLKRIKELKDVEQ